jgi:hypothetical protein
MFRTCCYSNSYKRNFESICFNFLSFFCELVFERFKSWMTLKVRN